MSLSTKPTLVEYIPEDCKIENWEDIPKAVKVNSSIQKVVETNLKGYEAINVHEAMTQLATVGELLKVANAAAYGFSCSVPIIGILADYQSLINDTVMTTSEFVFNSIAAINQHKLALRIAEKHPEKALVFLGKTTQKAKEMAEMASKLVVFAKNLVDKSTEALKIATGNQVEKVNEEKENQKQRAKLEARGAELRSEIEDLKAQVAEFKELADKAGKEAAEDRKTAMIFKIVGAVTQPLAQLGGAALGAYATGGTSLIAGKIAGELNKGGKDGESSGTTEEETPKKSAATEIKEKKEKLNKEKKDKEQELKAAETEKSELDAVEKETPEIKTKKEELSKKITALKSAITELGSSISKVATEIADEYKASAAASRDKETEYLKLKNQYQDLQRKSNAELAGSLVKLKSLTEEENYLQVSIKSLEITIKTMGRVRVIFDNTRLFWLQVEKQCQRLSDIGNMKDLSELASMDQDLLIDFTNEIKKSGLNWLSLGNINYVAAMAIMDVKKNFDAVMSNLPGRTEAKEIVKSCSQQIELSLIEENKKIESNSEQTKNEIVKIEKESKDSEKNTLSSMTPISAVTVPVNAA